MTDHHHQDDDYSLEITSVVVVVIFITCIVWALQWWPPAPERPEREALISCSIVRGEFV